MSKKTCRFCGRNITKESNFAGCCNEYCYRNLAKENLRKWREVIK